MNTNNSLNTIEKLYQVLGFDTCDTLISFDTNTSKVFETIFLEEAYKKLGVDSVFFYRSSSQSTSIPYIYFRRLDGYNLSSLSFELSQLHKLAWNMGQAPLMFVALPTGQVYIFNTYEPPSEPSHDTTYQTGLIDIIDVFSQAENERIKFSEYSKNNFESGIYWQRNTDRFKVSKRADQTLLQNLKVMRSKLLDLLPKEIDSAKASEIVHSLLGRSIFVKYLEDRRDTNNLNVFPEGFFGQFRNNASSFSDILPNKKATYQLFEYLDMKFNGDIFPVSNWEKEYIQEIHLSWLKSFILGDIELSNHQLHLWKFYSFDAIPIEFISNIYEEFFHIQHEDQSMGQTTGTHYTPHFLVEFLVDEVLPWEGKRTNFLVLDPACGSGIFLVEIYRRIIAHWQQANPNLHISFNDLEYLLVSNIYGVDLDAEAVRVAAFSLYLILCDYLEPRQIWESVKFPSLRNNNIFIADFFDDSLPFSHQKYDLIIGNPPWRSELTLHAENFRHRSGMEFPDRSIAPDNQIALAFLWHASELSNTTGEICLLVPSKGLLFNRSKPHRNFRHDFFNTFHVKLIINLSTFRHTLFEKGVGPGSAIVYTPNQPNVEIPILYCSPKPTHSIEDKRQIIIEPQDIAQLPRIEASENDIIWKVAMWGGPRDFEFLKKLMNNSFVSLSQLCKDRGWALGEGVTVGKTENRTADATFLLGKPFIDSKTLPRFVVEEDDLPPFDHSKVQWSREPNKRIFEGPHIVLKQSPRAGETSFRAALILGPAVFRDSLLGINGPTKDVNILAQCCLVLTSRLFLYFALMSSRRWLVERDELQQDEITSFPMPDVALEGVSYEFLQMMANAPDWEDRVNHLVNMIYDLTENDIILVDDAINYTLDYFRLKSKSNAVKSTLDDGGRGDFLQEYVQTLLRTLSSSFGMTFQIVVFQGESPMRVIAIHFSMSNNTPSNVVFEESQQQLNKTLAIVESHLTEQRSESVFIRRHLRIYTKNVIYIIKPDQKRFWIKSLALRDADEIYSDVMNAWGRS